MSIKNIDFSCKHDVLIRNPDGSLSHMDEPYFTSRLIAPGTWLIRTDGDAIYLVEGEQEAIVIDSGYGAGNIREYCQTLTDKPVNNIINTHDHFDHTANNGYFEKAYMSEATAPLATIPFPSFEGIDFPQDYEHVIVKEGDKINLGGRTLEIIEMPDHARGSISLLDSREQILFAGDEISSGFKKVNTKIETVLAQFRKLTARRGEIKVIWPGSGESCDMDLIDRYIETFEFILAGGKAEPGFGQPFFEKSEAAPVHQEDVPEGAVVYERFHARKPDMKLGSKLRNPTLRHVDRFGALVVFDDDNL